MREIITEVSRIDNVLNDECVYVDKTAYMHKLATSGKRMFVISRPLNQCKGKWQMANGCPAM